MPIRSEENGLSGDARANVWAVALKNERIISRLTSDDKEIEKVVLDLPNQRVVKNDCNRTRVGIFDDNLRDNLEKLLTYYCKRENITYKQGLNEVAAPFVNFMKSNVTISHIYNYLVLFIDKFLPTSFIDKDFLSLQCYFRTLELLIKYHDPNFHTFLNIHDLPSELYATPWFMTLFSSKMSLEMVYLLWDLFILENDPSFKFFIGLALLIENKNFIIGSETSMIPQTISNLIIHSSTQMKQIYKLAISLRMKTPSSFLGKIRELDLLKKDYLSGSDMKFKMERNVEYLESLQCVLVSPYEVINALYYTEVNCSDPECVNYSKVVYGENGSYDTKARSSSLDIAKKNRKKKNLNEVPSPYMEPTHARRNSRKTKEFKFQCILCQAESNHENNTTILGMMPHLQELATEKRILKAEREDAPPMDFLIIDLRQNKSGGLLPKSHQVDMTKGLDETINHLINDFIELKAEYHFVFMTTSFNSWVFKDSIESKNHRAKRGTLESLRSDRSNFKSFNSSQEEEWMIALLSAFVQNGFAYLSILEGGFSETNRCLHQLNLETINHNPDHCSVCRGNGGTKGPSFFNIINKVIDKTGEKLGLFVEGINGSNSNNNQSFADTSKIKDGRSTIFGSNDLPMARTSQGFFSAKNEDEFRPPIFNRDRESKPRSLNSVVPGSHIMSESTQETGDYYQPSVYNSEPANPPSIGSLTSTLSKYLQGSMHGNEDFTAKSTRPDQDDTYRSGRTSTTVKTSSALSSAQKQGGQVSYNSPKMNQANLQSSFSKTNTSFYANGSGSETKIIIGGNKPLTFQALNLGNYSSPKITTSDFSYKDRRSYNDQDPTPVANHHQQQPLNSQVPFIPANKIDTFNASRYVFDPQKKRTDEVEKKNETNDDLRPKRASNSQDKGSNIINQSLQLTKAKSNDKILSYNNYVSPSLTKMFKSTKQNEEDQRSKFYSTEFSISRPIFDQEKNNKTLRDKHEKSFKELKDASLADSFQIDTLNESRGKLGSGYASSSKAILESYAKQLNPVLTNSSSKKGTITQILKETTTTMGQKGESTSDVNLSGYQQFTKLSNTFSYTSSPHVEFSVRNTEDPARKNSPKPEGNLYLENLGTRDYTSPREVSSLRNFSQSPNPYRLSEKSSDPMNARKKDMTIETTLPYANYTNITSPSMNDIMKTITLRDDGKSNPRIPYSNEHYEKNAIIRPLHLSFSDLTWLYKTYENTDFSFYTCNYMKDAFKEDTHASTRSSISSTLESSSKRIIIVSKDFLVGLQYNPEIIEDLRLLQVGVSIDRILKRARENKSFGKSLNSPSDGLHQLLSPKDFGKNLLDYREKKNESDSVIIEAIFPVKLLLRITSKKIDAKFLSFYFKIPTLDKLSSMGALRYFSFTEQTFQELPDLMKKDEYLKLLREISDIKDSAILLQSKSVYCFETSQDAQECIQKTKDAYSNASSYITEKLKRRT